MNKKLKSNKIQIIISVVVAIFNIALVILGLCLDWLQILKFNGERYYIDNTSLALLLLSVLVEIFSIYHIFHIKSIERQLKRLDEEGHTVSGLRKVEAHLINYNLDSVEFEYLSAIENEIGTHENTVQNEIWVITNNFEEGNDSLEGKELRNAIISNLKHNVSYYYIVPSALEEKMVLLFKKIKNELKGNYTGQFKYIKDDALDFIPTPYFDIILYLKKKEEIIENSSTICYCFSQRNLSNKYYYSRVEDDITKARLYAYVKNYKKNSELSFIELKK